MINGIINVYKEKGYTSHDVVAKLRGILKQKKIGHTGTLDPDAEGVLPVCLGKGTKLCDLLTDKDKTYVAVMQLGITTDTQDMTGTVLTEQEVSVTEEEIKTAVLSFIGEYSQIPPMYSALKVNGKKLYELAREGKTIEREPRPVKIHEITILQIDLKANQVKMSVSCSKGTYIRTLCHDIGNQLGCGASMQSLVRTKVSDFLLEDSIKLEEIQQLQEQNLLSDKIRSIDSMFPHYKKVKIPKEYTKLIYNGNVFNMGNMENPIDPKELEKVLVYDDLEEFIGIYEYRENEQCFKPFKMFK